MRRVLVAAALIVALVAVASQARRRRTGERRANGPALVSTALAAQASNVLPADYVGSEACRDCHGKEFKAWATHPHGKMNRDANDQTVRGDFSGKKVPYEDGTITFSREKSDYLMTLERAGKLVRKYRVTRTVGSRFMQFYIGVEVEGPDEPLSVARTQEQKLPFGYWFKLERWLPTSYFDPVGAETKSDGTPTYDPYDNPRVHLWSQNCMLCHNTYAFAFRLGLPSGLAGFEGDLLMAAPLAQEVAKALPARPDAPGVRERMKPENLVALGVACEACHFGGKEHSKDETKPSPFLPTSPYLKLAPEAAKKAAPDGENAYAVNHICAQCHRANVTLFPNGAGTWNSREALDQMGGACASAIKCTDCHDPHAAGGPVEDAPGLHGGAQACLRCHEKYAKPEAARAHAHHGTTEVSCLDCHMPRVTQGLEVVIRTHRIASPVETKMIAAGSANACNLCHLDKSLRWTLTSLEKSWGRKVEVAPEWEKAYVGGLDGPVGKAWLEGRDQSMRLVATQAYARSPLGKAALPDLVRSLDDPVAVNRMFALFAVEKVRGRPVPPSELDPTSPSEVRRQRIEAILGAATK